MRISTRGDRRSLNSNLIYTAHKLFTAHAIQNKTEESAPQSSLSSSASINGETKKQKDRNHKTQSLISSQHRANDPYYKTTFTKKFKCTFGARSRDQTHRTPPS